MSVLARENSQGASASHERWLPSAQEQPGKRFWYEPLLESGLIPDAVIRASIRRMLQQRLNEEDRGSDPANRAQLLSFVEQMKQSPIALRTDSANAQHYEVPAAFFERVLGPRLKYSSAFYGEDCRSLAEAEAYAAQQVTLLPAVRCRIYDHHGLGREAIREIPGSQYKGEKDITPGFRRWVGSILFFGGVGLTILDWCSDFSLSWPAMIGTRVFPVGFVLLVTELVIVIEARRKKRREGWTSQ